jgi:hypothetical protein
MGLLSSLGDFAKKIVKVIDNPLTRTALSVTGLSAVGGTLSTLAGNQAAANAQFGAAIGSIYQSGPSSTTPGTFTQAKAAKMPVFLGNTLFPSIPGVSGAVNTVGKLAAPGGVVTALYDAAGNLIGHTKKRRRMNPTNIKAARRAIRRIRGTRRVLQRIERTLPTRTVHSRRK